MQPGIVIPGSNIISYPFCAAANTEIYPHGEPQYHARPKLFTELTGLSDMFSAAIFGMIVLIEHD